MPFFFILKLDNLWPWPSYINFSNRLDIIFDNCYYYLCEYIKGFINIFWKHYNFFSKYDLIINFFSPFFENVPFVTLTMTFTFIFYICLGFGVNERYFLLHYHISFFQTIFSYPSKKGFKLMKIPFFLILKLENLWPWPRPSCINFSNRFDIYLDSCYHYLCEYIKGFINIFWKHYIFFQNMI